MVPGEVVGRRFAGRSAYFEVALAPPLGAAVEVLASPNAARVGEKVFVHPAPDGPTPRAYRKSR